MPFARAAAVLAAIALAAVPAIAAPAHADEPFFKNKRLTILINFAPGGPTDIEGRLLPSTWRVTSRARPIS